jgi:hypothetical protein
MVYRTSRATGGVYNLEQSELCRGPRLAIDARFLGQQRMRREPDVAPTLSTRWTRIVLYFYVAQAVVGTAIGFAIPFLRMT